MLAQQNSFSSTTSCQLHYQLHPNSRKRTRSMEGVNKLGISFFAVNFCTIRLFKYLWVSATLTICLRYPQIDIDVYCPVYIPDASTCPMLIWMEAWSSALMTLFVAELIFVKCSQNKSTLHLSASSHYEERNLHEREHSPTKLHINFDISNTHFWRAMNICINLFLEKQIILVKIQNSPFPRNVEVNNFSFVILHVALLILLLLCHS